VLLEVIAEKTGYATSDLDLSMSLDADLGIDSIKRVEILSALQERLPDAPPVKPEHLGTLHTLGDIAAFLAGPVEVARTHPNEAARSATEPTVPAAPQTSLIRGVVRAVPLSAPRERRVFNGSVRTLGDTVGLTLPGTGPLAALVIVAPPKVDAAFLREALFAVQAAGPELRANKGMLVTVTRLDGAFGFAGGRSFEPLTGALAGLAKTASHEWPEITCRALDLAPEVPLGVVAEELTLGGPVEVGHTARGLVTLEHVHESLTAGNFVPFRPGDLVVVSGGARGVTAEAAHALARRFRPTLVLLGRSPEPTPEPDWLVALPDEAALKRELPRRLDLPLRQVGERVKAILAAREIRQHLERMRQTGARALYRSVDIRDAAAVSACLVKVRGEHGPVRGVVHGAGVLADALIADKKPEQFDAVWGTKIEGLHALLSATAQDDLRALVLFSSSTARFGRTGQVDYAMANEALNKTAARLAAERPGCRVVSFNWGPWAGGMVTPGLAKLFASEGVGLIPLEAGADLMATELTHGPSGPREIVVLASGDATPTASAAPAPPVAFERLLSLADHPALADHVLDGKAVLPFALMLEWLAHAALVSNPGLAFHGADDLRVLKGVILDGNDMSLRFAAGKASKRGGLFVVPVELRSQRGGKEVVHARGEILLTGTLPPPPDALSLSALPAYPHAPYDAGRLFHGPRFHALRSIDGLGPAGVLAQLNPAAPPAEWMRRPLRHGWITEPLAVDAAFQAMILWTRQQHGVPSLPTFLKSYRQYRRAFPATGCRLLLASRGGVRADFDLVDEAGQVVARVEGCECVMDASLERAFGKNHLAE
jgi:NAD(P)-dependent dehydrogenase (short-subunit alcohol dehydrogenase family)/acyl carrier protein